MHKSLLQLNRLWRLLATGLLFIIFGIGALLLSTIWFNLLYFFVKKNKKRYELAQNTIRYSFKLFLLSAKVLRALDYRVVNIEKLQEDSGCIVVANHPCLLDYVLLASVMPKCSCIVKQALLNNFFLRGVIKAAGHIANGASEQLLIDCQQRLKEGGMILIFPEGTRTATTQKVQLQRGAANIAIRCQVNIRVIYIVCNEIFLTKNKKWYHVPLYKPVFTIEVRDKVLTEDFIREDSLSLAVDVRRLTNHLTELLDSNAEK